MDLCVASSSKIAHRSGASMTPSRETRVDSISLRIAVLLLCRSAACPNARPRCVVLTQSTGRDDVPVHAFALYDRGRGARRPRGRDADVVGAEPEPRGGRV